MPALIGVILITLVLEKILLLFAVNEVPAGIHAARQRFALDWQSQLECLTTVCFKGDLTGGIVGPLWTLAYEIQLYFLAGVGAFVVWSRSHPALKVAVLVAVVAALKGIILLEASSALNIRKVFFVCFAVGFAAYLLRPLIRNSIGRFWPVPMLAALACMTDYFAGHTPYLAMYSDAWLLVALMLFGCRLRCCCRVSTALSYRRGWGVSGLIRTRSIFCTSRFCCSRSSFFSTWRRRRCKQAAGVSPCSQP